MANNPLAIDLYAGLGGWTEGLLAEGWDVIGFDIERHMYWMPNMDADDNGAKHTNPVEKRGWTQGCAVAMGLEGAGAKASTHLARYPGQLVLMDVCQIHGAMFKDADLIVASPPCQEFSYRAMPWKRAKALPPPILGTNLFWQCWRIQHEACEAAGRYIPMVVENVRGAQKWVGSAQAEYGSFMLWGDVRRIGRRIVKAEQPRFGMEAVAASPRKGFGGTWFHNAELGTTNPNRSRTSVNPNADDGQKVPGFNFHQHEKNGKGGSFQSAAVAQGTKQEGSGAAWFDNGLCRNGSASKARKAASAQIAKIPEPLARHIARIFKP